MPAGDSFVKLPDVLSRDRRGKLRQRGEDAREAVAGYEALLVRAMLAEMALYRIGFALEDLDVMIGKRLTSRSGPVSVAEVKGVIDRVVRDYAEPVLPALREAIDYTGPGGGWYLPLEEMRAKLVGAARAERRLAVEGVDPDRSGLVTLRDDEP